MKIPLAVLNVDGDDATSFLQGQLTAHMQDLQFIDENEEGRVGLGGLCNIKGRLEAVCLIIKNNSGYDLVMPEEIVEDIKLLLSRYLFRSKVILQINVLNDDQKSFLPKGLVIPWILKETRGKYIPQMVSLDILKGIHPKKGCYIGQEIVTRMRDLGKNKKRLARLIFDASTPICIGDQLDHDAGEILLVDNQKALAVIQLQHEIPMTYLGRTIEIEKIWKNSDE